MNPVESLSRFLTGQWAYGLSPVCLIGIACPTGASRRQGHSRVFPLYIYFSSSVIFFWGFFLGRAWIQGADGYHDDSQPIVELAVVLLEFRYMTHL